MGEINISFVNIQLEKAFEAPITVEYDAKDKHLCTTWLLASELARPRPRCGMDFKEKPQP